MMTSIIMCILAMVVGFYTFAKHLNAFNKRKTPAKDAWLLMVGMLTWSFLLHFIIDRDWVSFELALAFYLIYWIGDNLKIQNYCKKYFEKKFKKVKS